MQKIKTTDADVYRILREIAAERPDYVYEAPGDDSRGSGNPDTEPVDITCFYVHGDEPGCIIGHLMHRLGVPLEALEPYEGQHVYTVLPHFVEGLSDKTSAELWDVQTAQDNGRPWKEAVLRLENIVIPDAA